MICEFGRFEGKKQRCVCEHTRRSLGVSLPLAPARTAVTETTAAKVIHTHTPDVADDAKTGQSWAMETRTNSASAAATAAITDRGFVKGETCACYSATIDTIGERQDGGTSRSGSPRDLSQALREF